MNKNGWPALFRAGADTGGAGRPRGSGLLPAILLLVLVGAGSLGAQAGAGEAAPATTQASADGDSAAGPRSTETMRLTVDEAVKLALENNLSLQTGAIALDTKRRANDLVWNQFLPDLAVRGTLARQNAATSQNVPVGGTFVPPSSIALTYATVEVPQWHVSGNFSVALNLSAAMFAGIQTIKADYQAGLVTYEKASLQVERDLRKDYNTMLLIAENIALLRESYEAADRQVAMAQANYRAGLAPELTLLQAQVSRDNMKPNIDQAENGLALAQARFAMTLGLPYETRFELVPAEQEGEAGFISLDLAEIIREAVRNKPDIRELQRQLVALEKSRKARALQANTPYLRFDWGLSPTFSPALDPFKETWFKRDNWSDGGTFSITIGIAINSLFPFTKEGQAVKDIDNQIRTMTNGISQMIQGTELEVYNTLLTLERVQSTVEAQNRTVALAEQSYALTETAYRAGLQDFLQVQNAELQLHQARLGILEQEFNYRNGLIDLEYAMGLPFGTLASREGGN
jgi:outer membrane protein TolC